MALNVPLNSMRDGEEKVYSVHIGCVCASVKYVRSKHSVTHIRRVNLINKCAERFSLSSSSVVGIRVWRPFQIYFVAVEFFECSSVFISIK